jgi:hypothetical protein
MEVRVAEVAYEAMPAKISKTIVIRTVMPMPSILPDLALCRRF